VKAKSSSHSGLKFMFSYSYFRFLQFDDAIFHHKIFTDTSKKIKVKKKNNKLQHAQRTQTLQRPVSHQHPANFTASNTATITRSQATPTKTNIVSTGLYDY
jgi:hypothetical protein